MLRSGEVGRRRRAAEVETPKLGELLLSRWARSGSRTEDLTGDGGGKVSSTGLRGIRILLGDPLGLCGLCNCGDSSTWPEPLEVKPGIDWVRDIGGARLATDLDRE